MKIFTFFAILGCIFLMSLHQKPYKKFLKNTGFVFVPSGNLSSNDKSQSIQAFMMLDHEITNLEYREFIHTCYLSKGDTLGALAALPDTAVWSADSSRAFLFPLANLYYRHPAYNNYPVVNVSKTNAEKYCNWLTNIIRQTYTASTFNDFRLPTEQEWTYAAKGGLQVSPYPWGGPYTRNSKGCYLANFNTVGEHNLTSDENGRPTLVSKGEFKADKIADGAFATCITKSYPPNGFGLYDMAGNVAEMIKDDNAAMGGHWNSYGNDIQVTSKISFDKANPFVGFRPVVTFLKTASKQD
ncbi:MAG: SUMF1/EgtB/PvdO family nonheme iron enzyme [Putridiphycobacter sp.]|nr:SUMF1/EgtB/PvdO family nonheme iron enzyme [Putridiphycobacter sp.]